MWSLKKFLPLLLLVGIFEVSYAEDIKYFMEQHQVVPDVISIAPQLSLKVTYEGGLIAENGIELTPTQVKSEPYVTWDAEDGVFYTLVMVGPDTPSRAEPKMKELRNWLVINIPGNDISKGDLRTEYIGSGASEGTGLHRYVILLYKQPEKLNADEEFVPKTSNKRWKFSLSKFVEKYNLGVPIAGNFFQAQYDDYVPVLHKQVTYDAIMN